MELFKIRKTDGQYDTEGALQQIEAAKPDELIEANSPFKITHKYSVHAVLQPSYLRQAINLKNSYKSDEWVYLGDSLSGNDKIIYPRPPLSKHAVEHAKTIIRAMVAKLNDDQLMEFKGDDFINSLVEERKKAAGVAGSSAAENPIRVGKQALLG